MSCRSMRLDRGPCPRGEVKGLEGETRGTPEGCLHRLRTEPDRLHSRVSVASQMERKRVVTSPPPPGVNEVWEALIKPAATLKFTS